MSVNFTDYFSAECSGYDVLYQNMKYGLNASKEFSDFLRERSGVEETNSKLLTKLAKQAGGGCLQGTFAPVWGVLRSSAEKLSTLHQHMFHKVSELVKDVSRYAEDLHKKHKAVKDSESGTLEAAVALQATRQALHKARDLYGAKAAELEKLRKEGGSLDKAEAKVKKLHDEYCGLVEKHAALKRDFDKKMTLTCKHFQDVEEAHLKQMKQFVSTYIELSQNNHDLIGQVHIDFKHQCLEMTVDRLLEQFVREKYSALEKASLGDLSAPLPKPVSANNSISESDQVSAPTTTNGAHKNTQVMKLSKKEPSFASKTSRRTTSLLNLFTPNFQSKDEPSGSLDGATPCSAPSSPSGVTAANTTGTTDKDKSGDSQMGRNPLRESKWFLGSRRAKAKLKKSQKKKKDESGENPGTIEDKSDLEEKEEENVSKDVESIQSPEVDEDGFCIRPKDDKGSIYSSTDSDSEEEREQKIHVEIKPLSNGAAPMSASVDELLATVEHMSLYPPARRGSSATLAKPSSDLLGLNLFQSPGGSDPASPAGNPYAPLHAGPGPPLPESPPLAEGDLFSEVGDISQAAERRAVVTPSTGTIALPRPPSRRSEGGEFRAAGVTGSSRGPSPLTIGMADTIPLAVAFHEIVHCYFRGADETKCQVKMSGDMMLSFPTGIVGVLANNPNPARLRFRLRSAGRLDNLTPNKQLITVTGSVLEFNMSALTALLRRQAEKNPSASYFNVDILKYQVIAKPGATSCPFQLVAYWKCELAHTDLKIDYKYNLHAMSSPSPLLNLSVSAPVSGASKVTSMPNCAQTGGALVWKFTELSQHSDNHGVGSLRARVEHGSSPGQGSQRATVSAQFNCEGATLSGVDFELVGAGYRLSLVKRRFVSGKYICDGD